MKLRITTLSIVASFALATAAYAGFGSSIGGAGGKIGKNVGKAVDSAASSALISDLNKKIAAEGCRFKDATTDFETTCSLSKVNSIISKHRSAIENVFGKRVYITVHANGNTNSLASARARNVRNTLNVNWWRVNTRYSKGGDGLTITAHK